MWIRKYLDIRYIYFWYICNIVTISEVKEIGVLETYNSVVANGFKRTHPELNRDMGWINSVERSRSIIEKLFKGEDASKEPKKE